MRELVLLPQPKRIEMFKGAFRLNADTLIQLLPSCAAALHVVALQLKQEIFADTGIEISIVSSAKSPRKENLIVVGTVDDPSWEDYAESLDELVSQAYTLKINKEGVLAVGGDLDGAAYALQTLRQIVRTSGVLLPSLAIDDWPSLPNRGLMLDVCRGKVPTLDTLKLLVDELAAFKINVLQLYTEHTFSFASHPRIGENCGSLTPEDILELDAYAHDRRLTLMPNLQAFGHCAHILRIPRYADLAESGALWSLSPVLEGTYTLLGDMFADLTPAFSCKVLNVDCDETWDLGYGLSAERCEEVGRGRVYLEHINRLRELAAENGCHIQMWGDILLHYPELVGDLAEDITLLDWHYEASDDYPSTRIFGESGRDFWVCPGTSSWNTIFPRIENANINIRNLIRQGLAEGAIGVLNTDWGDHGHYQPIGQSWYGYIYGAEQSWTGGETDDDAFDSAFGHLFFGANGTVIVEAIRAVGALNAVDDMARGNSSRGIYALLEDPVLAEVSLSLSPETLRRITETCEQAEIGFGQIPGDCQDRMALEEMAYSCRLFKMMARKAAFSQKLEATLASMPPASEAALDALTVLLDELETIEASLVGLVSLFEAQWMRRARRSEINISLGHFAGVRQRMRCLADWLRERVDELQAGIAPDYDLTAYKAEAETYLILGQAEHKRWNELGILR